MKKYFSFSGFVMVLLLTNCNSKNHNTRSQVKKTVPPVSRTGSNFASAAQTEIEYQNLMKTYKSETAEVLTYLLNDSSGDPKTSVSVENGSKCNMVLTISGTNYFKKIPIGSNKRGSVMVPKNQNYNFSGMLCNTVYQKTVFIKSPYNVKISN